MKYTNAQTEAGNAEQGSRPTVITQLNLKDYLTLREIANEQDKYRRWIIDQIQEGAEIEPGPLTAVVAVKQQKRFSKVKLEQILGGDFVAELHDRLEPTEVTSLNVKSEN